MLNQPGQVAWEEVTITKRNGGDPISIMSKVLEINIFEDLFSNTMSGNIAIEDEDSIIARLPILGGEKLSVTFKYNDDKRNLEFFIYKLDGAVPTNNVAKMVVLDFCSVEQVKNLSTIESRSFSGTNDKIVEKIFKGLESSKKIFTEPAKFLNKFISPKWNPLYAINWLSARTISANGRQPSYLFWENLNGFNFKGLESLFSEPVKTSYHYSAGNVTLPKGISKELYNQTQIRSYIVLEAYDFLDLQGDGMMSSEIIVKDLRVKDWSRTTYSYEDAFPGYQHLNNYPVVSAQNAFNVNLKKPGVSKVGFMQSNSFTGQANVANLESFVLPRMSFIQQMSGVRMHLSVLGNNFIQTGDKIHVYIPTRDGKSSVNDPYLGGHYLVSAIRHQLTADEYLMQLEVIKDSH
jgi:hypothetical protein